MSQNNRHNALQSTESNVVNNNQLSPFFNRIEDGFSRMIQRMNSSFHDLIEGFSNPGTLVNSRLQAQSSNSTFRLNINVSDFDPDEISTEVNDREIIVNAKHHEQTVNRQNSRQIQTKYLLPNYVDPSEVQVNLHQGMLVIEAPIASSHP